VHHWQLKKK
jgi:hypothetical protein